METRANQGVDIPLTEGEYPKLTRLCERRKSTYCARPADRPIQMLAIFKIGCCGVRKLALKKFDCLWLHFKAEKSKVHDWLGTH